MAPGQALRGTESVRRAPEKPGARGSRRPESEVSTAQKLAFRARQVGGHCQKSHDAASGPVLLLPGASLEGGLCPQG